MREPLLIRSICAHHIDFVAAIGRAARHIST
jgi:hypothetical protein